MHCSSSNLRKRDTPVSGLRTASWARRKIWGTSSFDVVWSNSNTPCSCPPIGWSMRNDTLQCHVASESPLVRTTSIGHLVQVPVARGTLICEIDSMRELFPALWFPITAIFGSLMISSVPQSRSALTISLSFCREKEYLDPPNAEGEGVSTVTPDSCVS